MVYHIGSELILKIVFNRYIARKKSGIFTRISSYDISLQDPKMNYIHG